MLQPQWRSHTGFASLRSDATTQAVDRAEGILSLHIMPSRTLARATSPRMSNSAAQADHALDSLAARLLAGEPVDPERAAREAMRRRLAGLFLLAVARGTPAADVRPATRTDLQRAAAREMAADLAAAEGQTRVLDLLGEQGLTPLVLKGPLLAQAVWPAGVAPPAGDFYGLFGEAGFAAAGAVLLRAGFRETTGPRRFLLREARTQITLASPPELPRCVVDLHRLLHGKMGRRSDTRLVLGRALPRALLRRPVLELEPGDQLVFLCAHASVHGLCRLVQVLDLFGMATRTSAAVWDRAAGIACATGLERSFWAAAHVIAELPGVDRDSRAGALDRTRPPQPVCRRIQRVVNLSRAVREVAPSRWEKYLLYWSLEPSLTSNLRRALGVVERLARGG